MRFAPARQVSKAHRRLTVLAAAAATCALLVVPVAIAGSGSSGDAGALVSAEGGKVVKKLKKQIIALTARVAALEGKPDQIGQVPASLPPSGPAGGDLIGNYPSPLIGPNAVGSGEVAPNALTSADIQEGTLRGITRWARVHPSNGITEISTPENITMGPRPGTGLYLLDFHESVAQMALHVTLDNQLGQTFVARCDTIDCGAPGLNDGLNDPSFVTVGTGTTAGALQDRGFWVSASP